MAGQRGWKVGQSECGRSERKCVQGLENRCYVSGFDTDHAIELGGRIHSHSILADTHGHIIYPTTGEDHPDIDPL